jgi:hypothetical protein
MKQAIAPPDIFYVNAAVGWLELGNPREALAELQAVAPTLGLHPDILEVRWQAFARMESWEPTLPIARSICQFAPERAQGWLHQAVSLYRLKRTEEAWNLLLPMAEKFPKDWVIPYDLACYACQLGKLDEGRQWLKRACNLGHSKEVRNIALADPDLEILWPELEKPVSGV